MATKLTTITGHYHSYVEDQVLTHYPLNETIDYFDDQNRLQNVFLTGTGIACGFQVSTNADYDTVTITQGTGITTDGDLIKLKKETNKPLATALKQKLFSVDFQKIDYKSFKLFDNDKANYPHFLDNSNEMLTMWELLPEKTAGTPLDDGESLLTDFDNLKDHVVLLYLEHYTKEASLCDEIDCSNKGDEEIFNLRVLVVSQETADVIIGKNDNPERDKLYNKYDVFEQYSSLEELGVKKVVPTFNSTSTEAQIRQLFNNVVNDSSFRTDLITNLTRLLSTFGYNTDLLAITNRINVLFTINPVSIPNDIHYRYDLLKDVVATYKELKDVFIQLKSECNPPIDSFPKHLLLGLVEDSSRFKAYRHQFYKAPILDQQNKTFNHFESLVRRLRIILDNFQITASEIKITPSKSLGKLGSKSVPYYYNVTENLLYAWDFEKSNLYVHPTNFSYHIDNLVDNDCIKTPLNYCTDDYDFYRIEGYLNDSVEDVKSYLNSKRIEHGLDFDYFIMDLVENAADLKIMFNTNYGFEHKAGVKKGGTLLLLKLGATFITDFAIDGKINPDSGLGCCTIIECMYPWISTLRYINNLSRSLRGTPGVKTDLPTHYRLKIQKYSINGINLINNPVTISIPLDQLLARRLHVVMEKINTEFPTGLLFDFIEEEKKVKISKLEKDKFEFEIRDITLDRKSPVYLYTENSVLKNNKAYTNLGITCSLLNSHHSDIYKKLHNLYDPINKDDDNYGRFKEDWFKWEFLRGKLRYHPMTYDNIRFPKYFSDFNTIPIIQDVAIITAFDELIQIAEAITNADDRFNSIYIGGDWTNGNWVNPIMLDYYNDNSTNTDDYIVLFINLRKKLHNESNVSKYMIHIDNKKGYDTSNLNSVFIEYGNKADFYFEKPLNGGYFIKIDPSDKGKKLKTVIKNEKPPQSTVKKPRKPVAKPKPRVRKPRNGDTK